MADPITILYDASWDMLEKNKALAQHIPAGAREKLLYPSSKPQGVAPVLSADRPSIVIFPNGATPNTESTSSSSELLVRFYILVLTGSVNPRKDAFPLLWDVYCAALTWWDYFRTLTFEGNVFVVNMDLTDMTTKLADSKQDALYGWVGRIDYSVRCFFQTSAIRP